MGILKAFDEKKHTAQDIIKRLKVNNLAEALDKVINKGFKNSRNCPANSSSNKIERKIERVDNFD